MHGVNADSFWALSPAATGWAQPCAELSVGLREGGPHSSFLFPSFCARRTPELRDEALRF